MISKKYFIPFLVCFLAVSFSVFAQKETDEVDSLQTLLENAELHDTVRTNLLSRLSFVYRSNLPAKSLKYAQEALHLAQKIGYKKGIANALADMGNFNLQIGDYAKAIDYTLQALKIDEEIGNLKGISRDKNNLGAAYDSKGEIDRALRYYEESATIDKAIKDESNLSSILNNIGVIYQRKNELGKALEYFLEGLKIADKNSNQMYIGISLNNIGDVYHDAGNQRESIRFQRQALTIEQKIKDQEGIAYSFNGLARSYTAINQLDSAEYFALQALQINRKMGFKPQLKDNFYTLKNIAFQKKDFGKALAYADSTIALNDSLFSEDKNKLITQLQQKFELDKKQTEIESLQKDNIIKAQEIEKQSLLRNTWLASFGITLALVIGLFFLYFQRIKINQRLHKINQELNSKNKELYNLNATKDKLFSIISHDLRSPFNSLKSVLELMKENAFSPREIEQVSSQLHQNVENISYTLDNLLQWSISQMKGAQTNIEKINLAEIITETINFYQEVAKQKDITLVNISLPNSYIKADKNQVRLILRNLVNNALKFTFSKGTVTIGTQTKNEKLEVYVTDTGIGMTEEQVANLFSPANRSTKGTLGEKGTGLGLLLAKEFVENNGGEMVVKSKKYEGSTFTFSLHSAQK
jgi:signal transduction histidine kinase